jgi:16S rRNA (guanine(966)-N(2))-methyltransferase RsmD
MPMRVISGTARGRKLQMVPGNSTRPVMDRVKENLFNIIGNRVVGSRWLDLFAGTGSIGIEALSRGAEYCLFLDIERAAIATIHANLNASKLSDYAEVKRKDAFRFLEKNLQPFDFIYVAPPQYKSIWQRSVYLIDKLESNLAHQGICIVQIDPREEENLQLGNLLLTDQRTYGNTRLIFFERSV